MTTHCPEQPLCSSTLGLAGCEGCRAIWAPVGRELQLLGVLLDQFWINYSVSPLRALRDFRVRDRHAMKPALQQGSQEEHCVCICKSCSQL